MNWYINAIKNYCKFDGRATRQEFWMFVLFNFIVALVVGMVEGLLKLDVTILSSLYSLFILLPALGIEFRRLHDIGKSGWWLLISLVPIAGAIVLIVFWAKAGDEGANKYGEAPANTVV